LDQLLSFSEVELAGIAQGSGFSAAMNAGKIASPRGLPNHGKRSLTEVHRFIS
jgi:hypothetical protein